MVLMVVTILQQQMGKKDVYFSDNQGFDHGNNLGTAHGSPHPYILAKTKVLTAVAIFLQRMVKTVTALSDNHGFHHGNNLGTTSVSPQSYSLVRTLVLR